MTVMTVDTSKALVRFPRHPIGINLDYLRDADSNRPSARPIVEALQEMGVTWLRYPGGGKSDQHLWSQPPWDRPDPQVHGGYAQYICGHDLLDFDEYITYARDIGAEPFVVVGFHPDGHTDIPKETYLENAVQWVRYANIEKDYGVRYWEIGNENWMNDVIEPGAMAEVIAEFSTAMKAVDPGILTGSNGFGRAWWEGLLPAAAPHMDFLTLSNYPCSCWMGYAHYCEHPDVVVDEQLQIALEAIDALAAPADRRRLFVIVTELNSMDYGDGGWPNRNNLGHMLVTVEIFGRLLLSGRVRAAMLWNTRWVDPDPETIWYALDNANNLLPTGHAVAAWGRHLHDRLVAVDRTDAVVSFASQCSRSGRLDVLLTNKGSESVDVSLSIKSDRRYRSARVRCFTGRGPDDMHPSWQDRPEASVRDGRTESIELPGVSLTILSLTAS